MSQQKVSHCIGLQGLWPPYSVAYHGIRGACSFSSEAQGDRILILDQLLEKTLETVGDVLSLGETVSLAFPQGPGPFTGLRAVAAFASGLQSGKNQVFFCTPCAFTLCADGLPEGQDVWVCLPHHKRAVFVGHCLVHKGCVRVQSLEDVAPHEVEEKHKPVYWCGWDYGAHVLSPITAQKCAEYAFSSQDHTQHVRITYAQKIEGGGSR